MNFKSKPSEIQVQSWGIRKFACSNAWTILILSPLKSIIFCSRSINEHLRNLYSLCMTVCTVLWTVVLIEIEDCLVLLPKQNHFVLCPVHLPVQNIFCPGQNQICPRQSNFFNDKIFFVHDKHFVHS